MMMGKSAVKFMLFRMYELIHLRMVKVWLHPDWIFSMTDLSRKQQHGQKVIRGFIQSVSIAAS